MRGGTLAFIRVMTAGRGPREGRAWGAQNKPRLWGGRQDRGWGRRGHSGTPRPPPRATPAVPGHNVHRAEQEGPGRRPRRGPLSPSRCCDFFPRAGVLRPPILRRGSVASGPLAVWALLQAALPAPLVGGQPSGVAGWGSPAPAPASLPSVPPRGVRAPARVHPAITEPLQPQSIRFTKPLGSVGVGACSVGGV